MFISFRYQVLEGKPVLKLDPNHEHSGKKKSGKRAVGNSPFASSNFFDTHLPQGNFYRQFTDRPIPCPFRIFKISSLKLEISNCDYIYVCKTIHDLVRTSIVLDNYVYYERTLLQRVGKRRSIVVFMTKAKETVMSKL